MYDYILVIIPRVHVNFLVSELNPNAEYYGNRSAAYLMASKTALALADSLKSIELDPDFIKVLSRI